MFFSQLRRDVGELKYKMGIIEQSHVTIPSNRIQDRMRDISEGISEANSAYQRVNLLYDHLGLEIKYTSATTKVAKKGKKGGEE